MAGLADVLKGVLCNLSSPVLNEFWLLWGVGEDKVKLQSYLGRIEAVLQDAERRQVNDMAVKDWLREIKAAAHDAEDVLDDFRIEALRRKVENQEEADCCGIPLEKVSNLIYRPVFHIKIAHEMKKLRKNFEHIAKQRDDLKLSERVVVIQPRISSARETCSKIASEAYGRNTEKANLIDLLIKSENEEDLSVISIVGMGGLGKTTLAQLVFNDTEVVTYFQLRMWVYVSENFDVGKLLKEILESAIKGPTEQLSMELSQSRLQKELSGKRYLLVLDDVWNEDPAEWRRLKELLPCGAIGSKILVTTRSDTVARIMNALPGPPLGTLSADESWALFEKVAQPHSAAFVSIGKDIVKKCGGVPLAIKTLGGMLLNETDGGRWQSVRDSELWKRTDNERGILSILRLSYDHLTSSLKQCFAYCAVIPKGHRFNKDELIKQWIAQGFIHSHDDGNELLEEEGEEYFNALLRRSFFQYDVLSDSYNKMHDLIHDLLKSVAGKECLVVEASTMNDLTRHLALFNDETRHLALCNHKWAAEPKNLDALKKCKKLRSMIAYEYYCPIDINVYSSFFRCLRVLDLRERNIDFLPNSIDKLRHLRYFDISYARITELPETICNLHNLQTLIVFGIHLQKWPKNMKRMISLRHIEFDGDNDFPLPKGIGELTFLRTLPKSKFIIAKESGDRIEELKDLNLLWGNIHIGGLANVGSVGCAGEADLKDLLKAKKHVNSLTLSWLVYETVAKKRKAEAVIEVLEPHSNLKELRVSSYNGRGFPSWMTEKLTNLKKITLSSCRKCKQLPPLGQLVSLESLWIEAMDAVKYIVEFDGSHNYESLFPSLKDLDLWDMPNLEGWSSPREDDDGVEQVRERYNQVIFKCLHNLKINDCPKLIRPPRLPLLPRLESLEITEMHWDIMEIPISQSLMKVKLDNMPNLVRWSPHEADDGTRVICSSVRTFSISKCPKLICLPMFSLPAHEELKMSKVGCQRIELLRIQNSCENQISLPGDGIVLTSLRSLTIEFCGALESISADVLQNLTSLKIAGCPKLCSLVSLENLKSIERLTISGCLDVTRLLGSMENFTSLTELWIEKCPGMWSLPESVKNLKSLTELGINDCPDISSLPEWMGDLTLLRRLVIRRCPGIRTLPNGLKRLGNLNYLTIDECPVLRRKLRFPEGQDWNKVAHVPHMAIDWVDPRRVY